MSELIQMYTDGGSRGNPGPAGIGVLLCDSRGQTLQEHGEVIGEATNNIAEYTAVLVGLELAKKLGAKKLECFVDSQLVANQINGKYKIKTPHIKLLFDKVKESLNHFESSTFTHVPRENEKLRVADKLVNQALDGML